MRWRSRARYSAYSAGGPPPGETPPDEPPPGEAPGVASASPWPGRAPTPAPPSPPLTVVVDSSARPECPTPMGDAPGEAAVSVADSGFRDTAAPADVGASTETGALGAIAGGTAFVGTALSGARSAVVVSSGREISGASGGATARAGAESPPRGRHAPGDDAGARFARVPDGFRSARDPPAGFVGPLASVASVVRSMNSPGSEVRRSTTRISSITATTCATAETTKPTNGSRLTRAPASSGQRPSRGRPWPRGPPPNRGRSPVRRTRSAGHDRWRR